MILDGRSLTVEQLVRVAREGEKIALSEEARVNVTKARAFIESKLENDEVVYGVTTGFGEFSKIKISSDKVRQLQCNLVRSHAVGVGEPLSEEIVRAMMTLRVNTLAGGYSGIQVSTLDTLIEMLNCGVLPVVPCQGSVGSSGDLAPLSHVALGLIGEGEVFYEGVRMSAAEALGKAGISPVVLGAKEGLALINGTQMMTAIGALVVHDALNLAFHADLAAAMSTDVMMGTINHTDPLIHGVRPFEGQGRSAGNIRRMMQGSGILESHRDCGRVQDAYSMRCSPQVHGASYDAIEYVKSKIEVEMNSATDNPLLFPDENKVLSGGNFHGQPIALVMDFLAIAVAELANISERRMARLVDATLSNGLPAFLIRQGGVNSGMMIAQYTAASLVSENKILTHPSSVDSIPTSANQEDHVSMGTTGARKCKNVLDNSSYVVGIELMAAAQGLDLRRPLKSSEFLEKAYSVIRKYVDFIEDDRILNVDLEMMKSLIEKREIVNSVAEVFSFEREHGGVDGRGFGTKSVECEVCNNINQEV